MASFHWMLLGLKRSLVCVTVSEAAYFSVGFVPLYTTRRLLFVSSLFVLPMAVFRYLQANHLLSHRIEPLGP